MLPTFKSKLYFAFNIVIFLYIIFIFAENYKSDKIAPSHLVLYIAMTGVMVSYWIIRWRKFKNIEKTHLSESLEEGGTEEAQIFRDLSEEEKIYLLTKRNNKNFYLDSRSPVFKVQGKPFKHTMYQSKDSNDLLLIVRNQNFDNSSHENFQKICESIDEEEEIAVEYSPRTRHIWKIYKTEDLK